MLKQITLPALIVAMGALIYPSAIRAQESPSVPQADSFNAVIDQALDQAEEILNQTSLQDIPEEKKDLEDSTLYLAPVVMEEIKANEEGELTGEAQTADARVTKIIPLLHAEAAGLIEDLNAMKSAGGEIVYNEKDHTLLLKDLPEQVEAMSAYVKEVDILVETKVFTLGVVKAGDVIEKVSGVLTKNIGQAERNDQENSITVTDTPKKLGAVGEIIAKLDRIDRDFTVELKVLQIILNDEHRTGVDWEAIVSGYQSQKFPGFTMKTDLSEDRRLNIGVVTPEDYGILLEALDTVGVVTEISDKKARSKSGEALEVNILPSELREEAAELLSESAREAKAKILNEEVKYRIQVNAGHTNILKVSIQADLYLNENRVTEAAVTEHEEIQVPNGSTVVIGSLFEEVLVESLWKIPVLGDLPLLGFVFRNQGEDVRKAEIVTFLTIKAMK